MSSSRREQEARLMWSQTKRREQQDFIRGMWSCYGSFQVLFNWVLRVMPYLYSGDAVLRYSGCICTDVYLPIETNCWNVGVSFCSHWCEIFGRMMCDSWMSRLTESFPAETYMRKNIWKTGDQTLPFYVDWKPPMRHSGKTSKQTNRKKTLVPPAHLNPA